MPSTYIYAVSYDLGFAPNPFGGVCTLACCKPNIRQRAKHGDWIIGLTGTKLKPAKRCVFAMVVTGSMTFEEYWVHPDFATRRPKRNGSPKKQVGDNIYHRENADKIWLQENSVHSLQDGSQCVLNTSHDTRINRILISDRFIYYGDSAPLVPAQILASLKYERNPRDYRRFDTKDAKQLTDWLDTEMVAHPNSILGDPIDFASTEKRYSASLQRMV